MGAVESATAATRDPVELGRVLAFTDGVFAIATTLLVLNFEVPRLPASDEWELVRALEQLAGDFGAYFLTFAVVGRLWIVHHHLFATLGSLNPRLMTLNLAYLSMIVLIPVAAELLGDYGYQPVAPALYGVVLGVAAALNWAMARHALKRGFVRPE